MRPRLPTRIAWLGVASALIVACGPSQPKDSATIPSDSATAPNDSTETSVGPEAERAPSTDSSLPDPPLGTVALDGAGADDDDLDGVLLAWEELVENAQRDWENPVLEFVELTGCRWLRPGDIVFDLEFADESGVEFPVDFPLELSVFQQDMGTGPGGIATVSGAGRFSIPVDTATWLWSPEPNRWEGAGWQIESEMNLSCSIFAGPVRPVFLPIEVSPGQTPATAAPEGTVAALAATADYSGAPATSWTLASLLAHDDLPSIDRLHVATSQPLSVIQVDRRGECIDIWSLYEMPDEETVEVTQTAGCPATDVVPGSTPGWEHLTEIPIDDDAWTVSVVGDLPDAQAVAADLEAYTLADGGTTPADGFDADAYLDAFVGEDDWTEIGRFDWEDGRVALLRYGSGSGWDATHEAVPAVSAGFNAGSSGTVCRDWMYIESTIGDRGYIVVGVVGDRVVTFDRDGPGPESPTIATMTPSSGVPDMRAGLIDIDLELPLDQVGGMDELLVVAEPDGTPVPCEQW